MTMLALDGFDHYAAKTESSPNIATYLTAAGYTVQNAGANTLNIVDGQEAGNTGLRITVVAGSATPCNVIKSITTAASKIIFGFSFRGAGSRQRVCRISGQVDLMWDANTGHLYMGTDIGTDVIILNAYWFIEVVIDKTANTITVYANNTAQLTTALPGGAAGNTHSVQWGNNATSASAATIDIDDFYIVDNAGGQNTDRIGPIQAVTRAPSSDVTPNDWTPVGSTGSHASIVSQLSPNSPNAPYLQANVAGKTDMFASNTVLPNANQVFGVALVSYSRKGDLDDRQLGMLVKTAAGTTEADVTLTTAFQYRESIFEQAPGNVGWTQALVESSNFGIVAR